MSEVEVSVLVERAGAGEEAAWTELVDRYSGLIGSVTRGFRLSDAQAADVAQTTWLRLVENVQGIRDPEHVGAWLRTTARREALRTVNSARREAPSGDGAQFEDHSEPVEAPDGPLLRRERRDQLRAALALLPARQRRLLTLLAADPQPCYQDVAAQLGMPVGSIGPTRARALERLRQILEGTAVTVPAQRRSA